MQILIGKRFVSVLLIALFSFFLSDQPAAENIPNGQIVLTSSLTPAEQLPVGPQSKDFKVLPRSDLLELLFGSFLLFIGLAAIALSLFRWKANDLSLISFGVFCFFYGARSKALPILFDIPLPIWSYCSWYITYMLPIPFWIFAEQFLGKGWKFSIRRLLQIQIIFSISAIVVGTVSHDPGTAMVANNLMAILGILVVSANFFQTNLLLNRELKVILVGGLIFAVLALHANIAPLFTQGYDSADFEAVGFFVFIGCLGYVVARRFFQNEKELITISHELETARQIQSFILPGESVDVEGLQIAARYIPMASVAGDFYDFAKVDDKHMGLIVADVSGHGVPASLISSMVKIAFTSNISQASNPAEVLGGINQVLCGKLEADFVTAGYLFIDTSENIFKYAGAGHPPLFVWRGADQKIYEFRQKGTILGQFQDAQYQNISFNLKADDRIFLYTDGIVETFNSAGDIFGFSRLKDLIRTHANLPADQFADALIEHLFNWSGKRSEEALDDDLTLIVADYKYG